MSTTGLFQKIQGWSVLDGGKEVGCLGFCIHHSFSSFLLSSIKKRFFLFPSASSRPVFSSLQGTWPSENSLRKTRKKRPKIVWKIVVSVYRFLKFIVSLTILMVLRRSLINNPIKFYSPIYLTLFYFLTFRSLSRLISLP